MGVLSCHGFGDFAVGDCNSQTVIFLLEEVFEQELVDYLLREHVAVDIALLVALLFGGGRGGASDMRCIPPWHRRL